MEQDMMNLGKETTSFFQSWITRKASLSDTSKTWTECIGGVELRNIQICVVSKASVGYTEGISLGHVLP